MRFFKYLHDTSYIHTHIHIYKNIIYHMLYIFGPRFYIQTNLNKKKHKTKKNGFGLFSRDLGIVGTSRFQRFFAPDSLDYFAKTRDSGDSYGERYEIETIWVILRKKREKTRKR